MLQNKIAQIGRICNRLGTSEEIFTELTSFKERQVTIRPFLNGKKSILRALRIWHCNPHPTGASPYKGGFRLHPDVNEELLKVLAVDMTEKCAITDLGLTGGFVGGAKGGLAINPNNYSETELRHIIELVTDEFIIEHRIPDPDVDVFGPDVGTNSQTMFWIYNRVGKLNRLLKLPNVTAVVTGKPIEHNGCPGREDATAKGGLIVLKEFIKLSGCLPEKGATLAIQGFGNVGANLARLASDPVESNLKIVAVSDINGGIYNGNGLDFSSISAWHKEHKTFRGYKDAMEISNEQLLFLPAVDILAPAAIENQITAGNAALINAKIVLELANEAVTEDASYILKLAGIHHIPGIAANSGGVVVSFIEWARNRGARWHAVDLNEIEESVNRELRTIMQGVIRKVSEKSQRENISLNDAAHILAIENIYKKLKQKHGYK